jgi:hypothetical protein
MSDAGVDARRNTRGSIFVARRCVGVGGGAVDVPVGSPDSCGVRSCGASRRHLGQGSRHTTSPIEITGDVSDWLCARFEARSEAALAEGELVLQPDVSVEAAGMCYRLVGTLFGTHA